LLRLALLILALLPLTSRLFTLPLLLALTLLCSRRGLPLLLPPRRDVRSAQ